MKTIRGDNTSRYSLAGLKVTVNEAYEILEMYSDEDLFNLFCSGAISNELFLRMSIYLLKRINKHERT